MSSIQQQQPPQLSGNNIINWARKLVQYLSRTRSTLVQKTGQESASEDGIILFDRTLNAPVISIGGEFKEFTVEGGSGSQFVLKSGDTMTGALIVNGANIKVNSVDIGRGNGSSTTNTVVGASSSASLSSGTNNVSLGGNALQYTTNGSRNSAIGSGALRNNLTGSNNTSVGQNSLFYTNASDNTAVGRNAASSVTGNGNTYIGKFNGTQSGIDLRTANNHIVLSDGSGNPRVIVDDSGDMTLPAGGIRLNNGAELLSVYEEGNWVPTAGSGATVGTIFEAKYVRIGSLVYATCLINASCTDASRFRINGLPYDASNYAPAFSYFSTTSSGYTSYGTSNTSLGTVIRNSDQIEISFVTNPTFSGKSIMIYTHFITSDD